MTELRCVSCGGKLNIEKDAVVVECEYCGTKQTVPVTAVVPTANSDKEYKSSGVSKAVVFSAAGCISILLIIIIMLIIGGNDFNFGIYDNSTYNSTVQFNKNEDNNMSQYEEVYSSELSQYEINDNVHDSGLNSSNISDNVIGNQMLPQEYFNSSQITINPSQGTATPSTPSQGTATPSTPSTPSQGTSTPSTPSQGTPTPSTPSVSSPSTPTQPSPTWRVKEVNGGVEISGIETYNNSGNYVIPKEINGKKVVGIGDRAFYYEFDVKGVTIPDTVTYIGEQAFANCRSLTEVALPESVNEIRNNAFMSCSALSKVYIKSNNVSIYGYAFSSSYQQSIPLTIYAKASVITKYRYYFDVSWVEWNG